MKAIDIHQYLLDAALKDHDKLLAIVQKNGVITLENDNSGDIFSFFAKTIINQQLSYKSANAIWQKVITISSHNNLSMEAVFTAKNTDKLRSAGVSPNKLKACFYVKEALQNQLIPSDIASQTYGQISKTICAIWGCGQWTADMFAIFYCRLPDILPASDLALVNGIKKIYGNNACPERVTKRFKPYRTYLTLHIWRASSNKLI